jgi:hypothetical protein
MTDRVLHVSLGDPADPWTWWMRWGMAEPRFRCAESGHGEPLRFRARGPLTREQRAGLREDGRFVARGGWWYWQYPPARCTHLRDFVRCCEPAGHEGQHLFKCAGPHCLGYSWLASAIPHPAGCVSEPLPMSARVGGR